MIKDLLVQSLESFAGQNESSECKRYCEGVFGLKL